MLPNRSYTLGGEGWPAVDISAGAENRNILEHLRLRALQVRAGSNRTKREQAGTISTKSTQQAKFEFTSRSTPIRGHQATRSADPRAFSRGQSFGVALRGQALARNLYSPRVRAAGNHVCRVDRRRFSNGEP